MKRATAARWVFVLASLWIGTQPGGAVPRGWDDLANAAWLFLLTYGAPLLAYVALRTTTVHLVLRSMMKRAPGMADTTEPVVAEEGAIDSPPPDIRFLELDSAKGLLLGDAYQERLERALDTGRRTHLIFWQALGVFALMAAICLYAHSAATAVDAPPDFEPVARSPVDFLRAVKIGAGFIASMLIGFVLVAYAAGVSTRYGASGRVTLLSSVGGLLLQTALAIAVGLTMGLPWYLYAIPPIGSTVVVLLGYGRIWRRARAEGNVALLVLRVFGADRNTAFVFGPLMRSWRYLGAHFTIVDPSYIRYQFSLSSSETRWKLLRGLALIGLLVGALSWIQFVFFEFVPQTSPALIAWSDLEEDQQQHLLGIVVWLLLMPLAVIPVLAVVRTRFVRSADALDARIRRGMRRSAGPSGIFSGFPLYCYDNVWKTAVQALLTSTRVVLMDLRGFSQQRRGCEYEIRLLLNRHPIQRIVFLVDRGTKNAVYEIIRGAWAGLAATSPNRGLESPTIRVYAPVGNETRDVPRILALLVASSDDGGVLTVAGIDDAVPHGVETSPSPGKWRTLITGFAEALDAAVVTPRYARLVIPVMVLVLAGLVYVSARPVVEDYRAYSSTVTASVTDGAPSSVTSTSTLDPVPEPSPEPTPPPRQVTLTSTATAVVSSSGGYAKGRSYSNPLEVAIDFMGGAAADALRVGDVTIAPAVTDAGEPLELLHVSSGRFGDPQQEFLVVDRTDRDFSTKALLHPPGGVRVTVGYFKPEKEFARLKNLTGKAVFKTVDPEQTVTIQNIGSQMSAPRTIELTHPKLVDIGQFSLIVRDPQRAKLIVKGVRLPELDARLVDARGGIVRSNGGGTITYDGITTKDFDLAMDRKSLLTARLEIFLGYASFEAPFSFKNVVIKK